MTAATGVFDGVAGDLVDRQDEFAQPVVTEALLGRRTLDQGPQQSQAVRRERLLQQQAVRAVHGFLGEVQHPTRTSLSVSRGTEAAPSLRRIPAWRTEQRISIRL